VFEGREGIHGVFEGSANQSMVFIVFWKAQPSNICHLRSLRRLPPSKSIVCGKHGIYYVFEGSAEESMVFTLPAFFVLGIDIKFQLLTPSYILGPQRYTPPPGLGLEKIGKWLVWTIWWCICKLL